MKVNIGDRVRAVGPYRTGQEGNVIRFDEDSTLWPVVVVESKLADGTAVEVECRFNVGELEVIPPAPKPDGIVSIGAETRIDARNAVLVASKPKPEKRLYIGTIEIEYAVMATSEEEAREFADDAVDDAGPHGMNARVRVAKATVIEGKPVIIPPDGWEDSSLVYGVDGDLPWSEAAAQAIEREKAAQGAGGPSDG